MMMNPLQLIAGTSSQVTSISVEDSTIVITLCGGASGTVGKTLFNGV